jgi:enamine deaminase RidA (YjgF/YER057c/UK114 family)
MHVDGQGSGVETLIPPTLPKPLGRYSHLSIARGTELVAVAGQVAVDIDGNVVGSGDVIAQAKQAYANVRTALRAVGLDVANVWKLNAYVVGPNAIEDFMQARTMVYADFFPDGNYPPITLVAVSRLAFEDLLVEIEAIAVRPSSED